MDNTSYKRPMYLTAGNFPSQAANTLQAAKMAAAFTKHMPNLEVLALTGPLALMRKDTLDLKKEFGLSVPLDIHYAPLLPFQTTLMVGREYRPPRWFYGFAARWAKLRGADIVFTRKPETAATAVKLGLDTVLESHEPFKKLPAYAKTPQIVTSPRLLAVVVISETLKKDYIENGVPAEKIVVEPDGVDLDQYSQDIDRRDARKTIGLDPDKFTCVYSGHLYDNRGIAEIFEAAAALPDVAFVFVGGWPKDVNKYQELARSQSLANIEFRGHVPNSEVPINLFAGDVLLMPYNSTLHTADRCSPLKMFEYLAAGRVIVSSDLPVLHEVLRHNHNALMVPPDSGHELVVAIKRVMNEDGLALSISKNARDDSRAYGWTERAKRILETALGDRD